MSTHEGPDANGLNDLDRRIIQEIARGQYYDDIARSLHWTHIAVKVRMKLIYRKLGLTNRVELIQWAQEHL